MLKTFFIIPCSLLAVTFLFTGLHAQYIDQQATYSKLNKCIASKIALGIERKDIKTDINTGVCSTRFAGDM